MIYLAGSSTRKNCRVVLVSVLRKWKERQRSGLFCFMRGDVRCHYLKKGQTADLCDFEDTLWGSRFQETLFHHFMTLPGGILPPLDAFSATNAANVGIFMILLVIVFCQGILHDGTHA